MMTLSELLSADSFLYEAMQVPLPSGTTLADAMVLSASVRKAMAALIAARVDVSDLLDGVRVADAFGRRLHPAKRRRSAID